MKNKNIDRKAKSMMTVFLILGMIPLMTIEVNAIGTCERTITADVVALDQPYFYNRLGAMNPAGMIFALRQDVADKTTGFSESEGAVLTAGNVKLRSDKRPRPLTLRMNEGDCIDISFTNLLSNNPVPGQPATREASLHITGLQLVDSIDSDGSFVGKNPSSLASPGDTKPYKYYAEKEGTYLISSTAAPSGGEGNGGSISVGLFGAMNVEPRGSEWYRSQVLQDELELATTGTTEDGHPIVNYDAKYPIGNKFQGKPILKMLDENYKIVHSDLNAIITGPNRQNFQNNEPLNPVYPDRNKPFREFTAIFHDESFAVQAFPAFFENNKFKDTLHSVRDSFGINYGTGGAGAEIIANRLGLGPMKDCVECKYEEFFLTSWAVGDPAMVVDIPANAGTATKAVYPDDTSNVFSSYMNDRLKIRNLHAGPKEHHIFHLHAHQWLFTPDSDNSNYLDSQHIGPGMGFTYEIAYNSGNRNKDAGDAIFHCHFYPHFAQGMWALWRVHDVFEAGTELDTNGIPLSGSRAYPDGEIEAGVPIPAIVPIPGLAMAPLPEAKVEIVQEAGISGGQIKLSPLDEQMEIGNPGYPFHIPGKAGHRPPHPPLDTMNDGGLPRHIIVDGNANSVQTPLDFSKELVNVKAIQIPEEGSESEKAAMNFHKQASHQSFKPDGTVANFVTNGMPPKPGAPYSDPCRTDSTTNPEPKGNDRTYKIAVVQLDMKLNKAGWHFPQSRILTLGEDVAAILNGNKAPEPLIFRANTEDCVRIEHTVLVPHIYELDDYQVRTPTDVVGQHVHLVKFDVQASDGSGNGWNYEDGTFAPGEVRERIEAIKAEGGEWDPIEGGPTKDELEPKSHPFFGAGPNNEWLGAQTTVQRWYVDEVNNNQGTDRTLGTVYTHDHYGPSTVQQTGLYASFVIEPKDSIWRNPETGAILGNREDGGPTSWRADILTANQADSYREFNFQYADFQLAYTKDSNFKQIPDPDDYNKLKGMVDPESVINPPAKKDIGLPFLTGKVNKCLNGRDPPCPEAISAADVGTFSVNYRNEPIALRVRDPNTNMQTTGDAGNAGDLSKVYLSNIQRTDPNLNVQPTFYPPLTGGIFSGDPYTPLMRAYEDDKVQIRLQVGATEESHMVSIHGIKWLQEYADVNSGFRNSQAMGISEQFKFVVPTLAVKGNLPFADYLYQMGASVDDQWNGVWGMLRTYNGGLGLQPDLLTLPNNPDGKSPPNRNPKEFAGVCPKNAPSRKFSITAATAQQLLPEGKLVYNSRNENGGPLNDPTAILYVMTKDIDSITGKLKQNVSVEPLILRANAGDCIDVTLVNKLPSSLLDLEGFNGLPFIVEDFNANQVKPSNQVGLHPQLVAYDVSESDGANVGFNPIQTVGPGGVAKYRWYAGTFSVKPNGIREATPVEFGAINLIPSDPIKHSNKGAIGALIIEPQGSTWTEDKDDSSKTRKTRDSATVTVIKDGSTATFREFVVIFQDDINLRYGDGSAIRNTGDEDDSEDSGQKAINYRTEPVWLRMGFDPDLSFTQTQNFNYANLLSNSKVGGDPTTPVFTAKPKDEIRFRILEPNGHARNSAFKLNGHVWQREPYIENSTKLGNNPLSEWIGIQDGIGPTSHFDAIPANGAGGKFGIIGDYLYRNQASFQFANGQWGILRVEEQ